jgi:hypothetical protein
MRETLIKSAFLATAIALGAVLLAGCGGGSSKSSGATGTSEPATIATSSHTKAEFIKLADTICKREETKRLKEVYAYLRQHEKEGKSQRELIVDGMREIFLPEIQTQVEEIRALGAPKGDERQVEELLSSMQEAAESGSSFEPKVLKRPGRLARAYGLRECSYG